MFKGYFSACRVVCQGLVAFFCLLSFGEGHADLQCKYVAPIVNSYLKRHVNHSQFSKNLGKRVTKQFIKRMDPAKVYFLKSDVTKIRSALKDVFVKTARGDCSAVELTQKIFLSRLRERVEFAKRVLSPKFKFNKNTKLFLDPDKREYPDTKAKAESFLKKYIQFQISNYLVTDEPLKKAIEYVSRSYERNERRSKEMTKSELYAIFIDAFAKALDPHSSYFSKDELKEFEVNMSLSLEGIGASLSFKDGFTVIEGLLPGGAAIKSGQLKPKDKIVAVAQGKGGKFKNVIEMDLSDVVKLIRGKKGSWVRLMIARKKGSGTNRFEVSLLRDKINLEDNAAWVKFYERPMSGAKKGKTKVAFINLPAFYADSRRSGRAASKDIAKILKTVNEKNAGAVVLDLSTNGGGALDDAVKLAGLFFAKGNVVKQSHRHSGRPAVVLADTDPAVHFAGPLVILTSPISASASEILAGTLKEYKRAVIVGGDHTYGKGTVQSVEPLQRGELGAIKTTVGMFFTAGGRSTQKHGVKSDVVFPTPYDSDEIGEKTLDYSLPPKMIKPFLSAEAYVPPGSGSLSYVPSKSQSWSLVSPSVVKTLQKRSRQRVVKDKDFKKMVKELKEARAKKDRKVLLADLMKKREDVRKEKIEKGEDPDAVLTTEQRRKKYLERAGVKESVNIAFDMLDILAKK